MTDRAYLEHLAQGGELLRQNKLAEARTALERALELRSADPKALNLMGLVCFRLEDFDRALGIYRELVAKSPDDAGLRLNLGLVHLKLGTVDDAIRELSRARTLDPAQRRTAGYLGLAFARKGEYVLARTAFLEAGQDELAREMDLQLAAVEEGGEGGEGVITEEASDGDADPDADAIPTETAAHAGAVEEPAQIVELEAGEPSGSFGAPGSPTSELVLGVAGAVVRTPRAVFEASTRVVEAAVRAARGALPEAAVVPAGVGHTPPTLVSTFATTRLLRPSDGNVPLELGPGGTLVVRVRERIFARTAGVIVSGGELSYEAATRRVRGQQTGEAFGDAAHRMFLVSGEGHMIAAPRGGRFTALQLVDDIVYLREDVVVAFEDGLRWENGGIPGARGAVKLVQFRGEGYLALRTRREPLGVKLLPDHMLYVDASQLLGWIGRVVPRLTAPAAGGALSASFVECLGEGVVLVEEPEPLGPPGPPLDLGPDPR